MSNEYTLEQVLEAALDYFSGDTLASDVWANKYALKNKGKFLELTPKDTVNRVVNELYRIENKFNNPLTKEEIEKSVNDFKYFIPGGSVLFGIGNNYQMSSLGNCFFVDNGADSYGGIFNLDETLVQLMKRRGGVGVTLEHLRPSLSYVNNAAQSSTGAVSFMDRFSNSTREVAQDGRRGALMISLDVNHPDIKKFIMAKDDLTKITGANISVKINDEFIKASEENQDYILRWPITSDVSNITEQLVYNKIYEREDGSYIMKVKAKEIWDLLIKQAHKNAEPGILFWDTIVKESPADCYSKDGFTTMGCNPCLTGDTLIETSQGQKSIKELCDNFDKLKNELTILSYNERTQDLEYKQLDDAYLTKRNSNVIELLLEDNTKIKLTPDHRVYTKNRGWINAAKLTSEDILISIE